MKTAIRPDGVPIEPEKASVVSAPGIRTGRIKPSRLFLRTERLADTSAPMICASLGKWPIIGLYTWTVAWITILLVAFHPGLMSVDSVGHVLQGISGQYTNAHPPLFPIFLGLCFAISKSVWPALALNLAVLGLGILLLALKQTRSIHAFALIFLFTLSPPIWAIAPTLWTDVFCAAAMVSAVVALAYDSPIAAFVLLELATLVRHNGILAAAPLLLYAIMSLQSSWLRRCIYLGFGLLVLALSPKVLERALGVTDVWLPGWLMLDDLAGVYAKKPSAMNNSVFAQKDVTASELRQLYSQYSANTGLARYLEMTKQKSEVRAEWLNIVRTEPLTYLKVRFRRFATLLHLYRGQMVWYPFETGIEKNPLGLKLKSHTILFRLVRKIEDSFVETFVFRGWIWLSALAIATIYAAVRKGIRSLSFWAGISGLAYGGLGNFFFAPAADFRYLFWPIVSLFAVCGTLCCGASQPKARAEQSACKPPPPITELSRGEMKNDASVYNPAQWLS